MRLELKKLLASCFILCSALTGYAEENKVVKVFLLGGQSNMSGIGSVSKLKPPYSKTRTSVKFYHDGEWTLMAPGLIKGREVKFGPEISFAHSLEESFPNEDIRIIKYAVGGTNLFQQWNATTKGKHYLRFMGKVKEALASLDKEGIKYEVSAMLWLQGEADANKGKGDLYEKNLIDFITSVRKELKANEMPFILARIRDYFGHKTGHNKLVRDAQMNVPKKLDRVYCFDTDDCSMKNKGHYDADGYITIGKRFAETYLKSREQK